MMLIEFSSVDPNDFISGYALIVIDFSVLMGSNREVESVIILYVCLYVFVLVNCSQCTLSLSLFTERVDRLGATTSLLAAG